MRRRDWSLGTAVCVTLKDGTAVNGQVWALAHVPDYVWVALDNGRAVAVHTPTGHVASTPSGERVGRVAA